MTLAAVTGVMGETTNDRTRCPLESPPRPPQLIPASNTFRGVEIGLVCVTRVSFNDVTLSWCRWRRVHFTTAVPIYLGPEKPGCMLRVGAFWGAAAVTGPLNPSAVLRLLPILWVNPAGGCIYRGRCQRRLQVDVTPGRPRFHPAQVGLGGVTGATLWSGSTNLPDMSERCERQEDEQPLMEPAFGDGRELSGRPIFIFIFINQAPPIIHISRLNGSNMSN